MIDSYVRGSARGETRRTRYLIIKGSVYEERHAEDLAFIHFQHVDDRSLDTIAILDRKLIREDLMMIQ